MVVIILLASLLASATSAQPAPCPAEYPYDPAVGTCVDPETGEPVDPTTGDPLNPGEGQEPTAVPTVELPAGDLASFTLYHLACDDDFQANAVRDAGGVGPTNGCLTFGKPPFTYTISANGTAVITSTVEAVGARLRPFRCSGSDSAGSLTISVAQVTDYTTEFISCGLSIGDGPTDVVEPAIAGGAATLSTLPDQDVECWVYNVTRVPDPTVGDTIITSSGGSVNMSFLSLSCPAGTTIDAELDRNCTEGLANVTYEILSETATLARNTTDGNGVLIFENVPDGQLAIVESVPAGYGKPYVLCTHYSPTTGDREYAPTIEYGTGFTASVAPGDDLNCTWFNFPAAGPDNGPTIMIQTRWCEGYENGFAADASLAEAEASCPPFSAREEFQVSLDGQAVATDQSNDINGQVTFTKLPVSESGGLYGIALLAHQDAQTVAVYCDKGTGDGVYAVVPSPLSAPDRIDQQLAAGETLRCSWFINYPYGPTGTVASDPPLTVASDPPLQEVEPGIFLVARLCNPGADLTQTDIDAACPTPGNGIGFNVAMAGEPYITTTTDAEGVIDVPLPGGRCHLHHHAASTGWLRTAGIPLRQPPDWQRGWRQGRQTHGGRTLHDVAWSSNSETTCTYYFPVVAEEDAADDPDEEQDGDTIRGRFRRPGRDSRGNAGRPGFTGTPSMGRTMPIIRPPEKWNRASRFRPCNAHQRSLVRMLCSTKSAPSRSVASRSRSLLTTYPSACSVDDDAGNLAIPADAGAGMYQFRHQPSPEYLEKKPPAPPSMPTGARRAAARVHRAPRWAKIYLSYDDASRVTCTFYFVIDAAVPETGDAPEASADSAEGQATPQADAGADAGDTEMPSLTLTFLTCPEGTDQAADPAAWSRHAQSKPSSGSSC